MKSYYLLIISFFFYFASFAQSTSLHEDFSNCLTMLPNSWQQYSVSGSDAWSCTTYGKTGNAVSMSGYSNSTNNLNEDWLISPSLNLAGYGDASFSFWSRTKYSGTLISVFISTNYSGTGNPNAATWTNLSPVLPAINSDYWQISNAINLNAYKTTPVRIAFKYTSTTSSSSTWRLDDLNIIDNDFTISKKFINVGEANVGAFSQANSFTFTKNTLSGTLHVNAPSPFQVSSDNVNFNAQLSYTSSINGQAQTVYVRIAPTQINKITRAKITFDVNGNSLASEVNVLGTSLPDNKTLRVFNWNMRWFGDPTNCNCDTTLALQNAITIFKDIKADVYCLQEVVSKNQIANIANALGANYDYVVSPYGSGATSTTSPLYAEAQKLAYIFNKNKIQNAGTVGLLASTYPANSGNSSPYYCFSSGRFPFIMKAKIQLNSGNFDTIIFANIHAKASGTQADYDRRVCAVSSMTDSLMALYPSKKVIVIGDFNDYLEGTSVSGQTISPYKYLLDNGYVGVTLPSKFPNQTTFIGSSNHMIDNVVCSPQAHAKYVDSSCFIFTETMDYIDAYGSTTSDHIPVMSYYAIDLPNAIASNLSMKESSFNIVNPSTNHLIINFNKPTQAKQYVEIYNMTGQMIFKEMIPANEQYFQFQVSNALPGIYVVMIKNKEYTEIKKWLVKE